MSTLLLLNMEPTGMLHVLISVSLISQSVAFLPSHAGITLPDTDYTLTDLTLAGIIRVVARYFEDTNPDRYSPGNLTNLDPLTPSSLFMEHYGECASWEKFEGAIDTITNKNIETARMYAHNAEWHFNGNQINAGHRRMMSIRQGILQLLTVGDENAPDYDVARKDCGQFLHLAHSFYSNTNWIELKRFEAAFRGEDPDVTTPSYNLSISDNLEYSECPETVAVCRDCEGSPNSFLPLDCSSNLHETSLCLVGGYRSGQDITKTVTDPPTCSHGGINDGSRFDTATGGINKETSERYLSPHYLYHQQAALTAIQATVDFFYHPDTGLYNLIGEQKFRKLLNLDVGTSLTMVIDTTGSMSEEIRAVREETIEIVNTNRGTCLAASKYVIVPFNDPDFGPAFVTTNPEECIEYISGLGAHGGGDCPELANSGLELGIQNSLDGNIVYVFTDADDKDKDKLPDVEALIKEKRVTVTYLLTGDCPSRRRKRAISTTSSSYLTIASKSGGDIYITDDAGIRDLTRVIQGNIRASQVTVLKIGVNNTTPVKIPVDTTIPELLVSIFGPLDDAVVTIMNPQGTEGSPSYLGADIFTSSAQQIVFSINTTLQQSKGNWTLKLQNVNPGSEYKVTVSARSLLDFNFDLLEVDQSETAYPLEGLPVAGAKLLLQIRISSQDLIRSISEVSFHDTSGRETLFTGVVEPLSGRTQGLYVANVTLPHKAFLVSLVGVDNKGASFLRTEPAENQVVEFKLEQVIGNNTIEELYQGGEGSLIFRVTNKGPADTMDVDVSIGANRGAVELNVQVLNATVEPLTMELAPGQTQEGVLIVRAADNAPIGITVKVTISVSSSLSPVVNILSADVTVVETPINIPKVIDSTPPTCTVLATGGGCTADQMSKNCHLQEWWVRIQATDETTLTEFLLEPQVGISQSLEYEEISLRNVIAIYKAPCCCPKLNITVRDGNGNTASCGNDFYTPEEGKIKEPICNGPIIDSTPPTCTLLDTGGGCTADQMSRNCHLQEWWVRIQAKDDTNLTEFLPDPEVGLSQSLEYEESSFRNVTALYRAPCCCPKLNITVRDGNGNTASCGNDFYTPVAGEIKEPICNGPIVQVGTGLGTGGIVGIVAGCVVLILIIVIIAVVKLFIATRKENKEENDPQKSKEDPVAQIQASQDDSIL